MNVRAVLKGFLGGMTGLVVGTIAGCSTVVGLHYHRLPPLHAGKSVAWDPDVLLRSGTFWFILLACILGFTLLATRIGWRRHSSHL